MDSQGPLALAAEGRPGRRLQGMPHLAGCAHGQGPRSGGPGGGGDWGHYTGTTSTSTGVGPQAGLNPNRHTIDRRDQNMPTFVREEAARAQQHGRADCAASHHVDSTPVRIRRGDKMPDGREDDSHDGANSRDRRRRAADSRGYYSSACHCQRLLLEATDGGLP